MSSPKSNSHQSKHNALNDYQRAVLQAMNIPLYTLHDEFKELEAKSLENESSSPALASEALNVEMPAQVQLIDENHTFVQQILSVFDVNQIAELGIKWQVHDSDTLVLNDDVLVTPNAQKLNTPRLKKQLWEALHPHFNAQKWS